jgi:hypothetical protein
MSHRPQRPEPGDPEWIGSRPPEFKVTDEMRKQVIALVGFGITQGEIATVIGCARNTLVKHFHRELITGEVEINRRVVGALYNNAVKNNNVTAQIWWTKARMGWKDTTVQERTETSYVVRGPPIVKSTEEWLKLNAPSRVIDADVGDC